MGSGKNSNTSTSHSCCPCCPATNGPGCRKCCSHPHGRRYNLAAAILAIIALALDGGALGFFFYYTPIVSTCLLFSGAGMGTIATVVSFTASCRAYRLRGLKWIASLYGLVFLCHFFSFAELIVWLYMGWWYDFYWYVPPYDVLAILVGVSSALWLVCIILALSVPPFDALSNIDENIKNGPRGNTVSPVPDHTRDEEEGMHEEEQSAYVQVKTVTAVPIPLPGLEEQLTHNNARFQKNVGPLDP